jgi:hypothetical protein
MRPPAATRDKDHQTKTGEQHAVGLGLGDGGGEFHIVHFESLLAATTPFGQYISHLALRRLMMKPIKPSPASNIM